MQQFSQEQQAVTSAFQSGFAPHRDDTIVLYGIGQNTKAILALTQGYHILGLMDAETTGQTIFGKRVLSNEEVLALKPRPHIAIIARATITPIIYERIRFLESYGVQIFDYAGRRLGAAPIRENPYQNHPYWEKSWEGLLREIDQHDVVTFDVFDTLIMRRVLQPGDVFSLLEREVCSTLGEVIPFRQLRQDAEKQCGYAAGILSIYKWLQKTQGWPPDLCERIMAREISLEKSLAVPRARMVEALQYACNQGKQVFLLSDMYLSKAQLTALLTESGISGYRDLIVSCDRGAEKSDGEAFAAFRRAVPDGRWLHIGDNRIADGEMAARYGADTWLILSAYELLTLSSLRRLLVNAPLSLDARLNLGMLAARLMNDPFALNESKGVVILENLEDLGYCFLGPWALGFTRWMLSQARTHNVQQILFPARDGYLFSHLYRLIAEKGDPQGIYFKASRRAVVTASLTCEADIALALHRSYTRSNQEQLREWFNVEPESEAAEDGGPEGREAYILAYRDQILAEAARERENYLRYLGGLGIADSGTLAIFDFVAGGTVQFHLEKLLGRPLLGLYFATMDHPNNRFPESSRVLTAYGNFTSYDRNGYLGKTFLALETILIDGDAALEQVDEAGNFVFASRHPEDYSFALALQRVCMMFANDWITYFGHSLPADLAFGDELLGALFRGGCMIPDRLKSVFSHDDVDDCEEVACAWGH